MQVTLSTEGACRGKRVWPNKSIASQMCRRTVDRTQERMEAYHCNRCHGWHIGSSVGTKAYGRRPRHEDLT